MNTDLWIGEPDWDAVARLCSCGAVPAHYYLAMGQGIGGLQIGRYGQCLRSRGEA